MGEQTQPWILSVYTYVVPILLCRSIWLNLSKPSWSTFPLVFGALREPALIIKGDTVRKHTPCSSSSIPSAPNFNLLKLRRVLIDIWLAEHDDAAMCVWLLLNWGTCMNNCNLGKWGGTHLISILLCWSVWPIMSKPLWLTCPFIFSVLAEPGSTGTDPIVVVDFNAKLQSLKTQKNTTNIQLGVTPQVLGTRLKMPGQTDHWPAYWLLKIFILWADMNIYGHCVWTHMPNLGKLAATALKICLIESMGNPRTDTRVSASGT